MFSRWALMVCIFLGCDPEPKTCGCKRCGRVKHLYNDMPRLMDSAFELCGKDKHGRMIYSKTQDKLYTCSRCGLQEIKISYSHVTH